jgi:hypothetical protein
MLSDQSTPPATLLNAGELGGLAIRTHSGRRGDLMAMSQPLDCPARCCKRTRRHVLVSFCFP